MYGYVYADPKTVEKFSAFRVWIPAAIVKFPSCRPKDAFLFDCYFCIKIRNPCLRVLLLKKMPKSFEVTTTPSVEAPRIESVGGCSESDIVKDLEAVWRDLYEQKNVLLQQLVDKISKPRDIELKVGRWFRRKRYVIPAAKLRAISLGVARDSLKLVLKGLCIDVGSPMVSIPKLEVRPVYVLMVLDSERGQIGLVVGKHVEMSSIHTAVLMEFSESLDDLEYVAGLESA